MINLEIFGLIYFEKPVLTHFSVNLLLCALKCPGKEEKAEEQFTLLS